MGPTRPTWRSLARMDCTYNSVVVRGVEQLDARWGAIRRAEGHIPYSVREWGRRKGGEGPKNLGECAQVIANQPWAIGPIPCPSTSPGVSTAHHDRRLHYQLITFPALSPDTMIQPRPRSPAWPARSPRRSGGGSLRDDRANARNWPPSYFSTVQSYGPVTFALSLTPLFAMPSYQSYQSYRFCQTSLYIKGEGSI